jgi:hypothetical protein
MRYSSSAAAALSDYTDNATRNSPVLSCSNGSLSPVSLSADYASGPVIMGSSSDSAGATGNNKAAL